MSDIWCVDDTWPLSSRPWSSRSGTKDRAGKGDSDKERGGWSGECVDVQEEVGSVERQVYRRESLREGRVRGVRTRRTEVKGTSK